MVAFFISVDQICHYANNIPGIQSFKGFLELILYSDDPNRPAKINILNDYLDVYKSRIDKDPSTEFLPDLLQAWEYAAQTNNDYLTSSVSSIFALLLKTLATLSDLREHGLLLCRTLLKPAQLKLLCRGVSAPKSKEHIISPCLRTLTEIVSFDGGVMAKSLYAKREWSFQSGIMARNLDFFKGEEDRRRPSVRSNAIRYLLANFRFQDEGAKIDILKHGNITKALFRHLKEDPLDVLTEIFKVLETSILRDEAIPRVEKSRMMNDHSLSDTLSALRTQVNANEQADSMDVDGELSITAKAKASTLAFLKLVCTTPSLGVLRVSGWYPPGSEKHTRDDDQEPEADLALDLGLDSVEWYDRYHNQVPVRNSILSVFLQSLRPHGSIEERDVLLATFKAGPELVADYFFKKADKFPFDPKLTNTWIGYASFLYSTVETPVPLYFGSHRSFAGTPPPVTIAIENILPLPLSQKVLTRCLNQSSDLIMFFAIRILIVAFQKLQRVQNSFTTAALQGGALWREASNRLTSEFCDRCPSMKDVIAVFRKIADDKILQKEAVSRLLQLYYEVIPQHAMKEKFDVSASLAVSLSRIETMETSHEQYSIRSLELEHLLIISEYSVGMRWWHKQGSLKFSPFTTLLRLCAQTPKDRKINEGFVTLIESVIAEHGILLRQQDQDMSAKALIASLTSTATWTPIDSTYTFLDDCLGRLVRAPIKYLDDRDAFLSKIMSKRNNKDTSTSLLTMVLIEQATFISKLPSEHQHNVMTWLSLFIRLLGLNGESVLVLEATKTEIGAPDFPADDASLQQLLDSVSSSVDLSTPTSGMPIVQTQSIDRQAPAVTLTSPPVEAQSHPELTRWHTKDVDEFLESGDISVLILCLSSQNSSVRLQALVPLRKLVTKIKESKHDEKDQLYILFGELVETATSEQLSHPLAKQPLPYLTTAFTNHAMSVVLDPSHFMYPKVNKYLMKGPVWQVTKQVSYWIDHTLLAIPDEADKHWAECEWVLDFLVDGTRTLEDALLLISRNSLEKILALFASPAAPKAVRDKVVQLLYRIAKVNGATSLVTRCGILTWLDMRDALGDVESRTLRALKEAVNGGIDEARMSSWSKGAWKPTK